MTTYRFACDECNIFWEEEGTMDNPPQPKDNPCPECSGESYREFGVPNIKFIGDFHTNRAKQERYNRDGMSKDDALNFYKDHIQYSKDRMQTMGQHYKRMYIKPEHGIKEGTIKKLDDKTASKKAEAARTIRGELNKRLK